MQATSTLEEIQKDLLKNRFVFVVFITMNCGPCKMLREQVNLDCETLFDNRKDLVFRWIDVKSNESHLKWAKNCGVETIPSTALFVNGIQRAVSYKDCRSNEIISNARIIKGYAYNIREIIEECMQRYSKL